MAFSPDFPIPLLITISFFSLEVIKVLLLLIITYLVGLYIFIIKVLHLKNSV